MPTVFVNYRGASDNYAAAFITQVLAERFGAEHIFRAPVSLRPGDDFPTVIWDALRHCSALVAVIDADWLTAGVDGRRFIDDPQDWVRREIAMALAWKRRVIPVPLASTAIPASSDLPKEIARLAAKQAVRVTARGTAYDTQPLVDELARLPALRDIPPPRAPSADQLTPGAGTVTIHNGSYVNRSTIHGDVIHGDVIHGIKYVGGKE